jgi:cysteine synthase
MKKNFPSPLEAERLIDEVLIRFKPDLVRLRNTRNVAGLLARPSKVFAAAGALLDAIRGGHLKPGQPLLETSSGTMALGLAVLCQALGLMLYLVVDRWVQPSLRYQLQLLGANVVFAEDQPGLGSQANRLRVLCEVQRKTGGLYLNQYDSSHNAAGYAPIATQIVEAGIQPGVMVFPVGSGASSRALIGLTRLLWPDLFAVGLDVAGSVPFGVRDVPSLRTVGGIGNSILPRNIDHTLYDEVHIISGQFAWATTRELLATEGLWRGETTGPTAYVARYYAQRFPESTVVFFSPDDGSRYYDTVWNPSFPQDSTDRLTEIPTIPLEILHPHDATGDWCLIRWGRRTYEQVVGTSPDLKLFERLKGQEGFACNGDGEGI